ncbi:hypothetical protein [Algoriphagus boritolerans]|uniref:hypothetical protein n=1 Tax=Algoriphagus boritolerans TaxID=308111 RepID=UPI002FCE0954
MNPSKINPEQQRSSTFGFDCMVLIRIKLKLLLQVWANQSLEWYSKAPPIFFILIEWN